MTRRVWLIAILALGNLLLGSSSASAQRPPIHYFQKANQRPGSIGQAQLLRGGPLAGYVQPVQIQGPAGSHVSVVIGGQFTEPEPAPVLVGMYIGEVYTLKITNIPNMEGLEVFPTIELVNRLYPPPGQKLRFPVPIDLTEEDLDTAASGLYVTRVIYLEDPTIAVPERQDGERTRVSEAHPQDDPLEEADRLGRPMAILRMGSRVVDVDLPQAFPYGTPPLVQFPREELLATPPANAAAIESAIIRERQNIPRLPLRPVPANPQRAMQP